MRIDNLLTFFARSHNKYSIHQKTEFLFFQWVFSHTLFRTDLPNASIQLGFTLKVGLWNEKNSTAMFEIITIETSKKSSGS